MRAAEFGDATCCTALIAIASLEFCCMRPPVASLFELYDPTGTLFWSITLPHDVFYSMSWWYGWHSIAGWMTQTGTWRWDYYNGSELLAQHTFELVSGLEAASERVVAPAERTAGVGGGGLRR